MIPLFLTLWAISLGILLILAKACAPISNRP